MAKYLAFKEELAWKAKVKKFVLPDCFSVDFYLSFPKSFSSKRRQELEGKPHQVKPDIDNLLKAILDTLKPEGDETVWGAPPYKYWSKNPRIEITIDAKRPKDWLVVETQLRFWLQDISDTLSDMTGGEYSLAIDNELEKLREIIYE